MISFRIVKNKGPAGRRVPGRYIDTMTLPSEAQKVPIKEEVKKIEIPKAEVQKTEQTEVLVLKEKDITPPILLVGSHLKQDHKIVDVMSNTDPAMVLPPPPSPRSSTPPTSTNPKATFIPHGVEKFLVGINTHDYDGILKQRIALFPTITKKRPDTFIEIVYEELMRLCEHTKLRSMFQDFMNKTGSNFDPTNEVDASLILACIYEKYMKENEEGKKDIISSLKIQLDEMRSGFCAQGRTTRLLQVLFPLLEK